MYIQLLFAFAGRFYGDGFDLFFASRLPVCTASASRFFVVGLQFFNVFTNIFTKWHSFKFYGHSICSIFSSAHMPTSSGTIKRQYITANTAMQILFRTLNFLTDGLFQPPKARRLRQKKRLPARPKSVRLPAWLRNRRRF